MRSVRNSGRRMASDCLARPARLLYGCPARGKRLMAAQRSPPPVQTNRNAVNRRRGRSLRLDGFSLADAPTLGSWLPTFQHRNLCRERRERVSRPPRKRLRLYRSRGPRRTRRAERSWKDSRPEAARGTSNGSPRRRYVRATELLRTARRQSRAGAIPGGTGRCPSRRLVSRPEDDGMTWAQS